MYKFPIGVMLESFNVDTPTAIKKAASINADGIQLYASRADHTPEALTPNKRRELMKMMNDNNLCFSALCGDFGKGFGNPELNPGLIEKSKRILDLALDLGTNIVTTHIGVVPNDPNHDRYKIMQEACFELSKYADSQNSHFAIETGPEKADVLKKFLDSLNSKGVAVNLDPANFVMVSGQDPVEAVYLLSDYIVHTHAKDGRMIFKKSPDTIYGLNGEDNSARSYEELPLGQGSVDFDKYLKALEEIGYRGFLTIEREVGDNPEADIRMAADFLRNKIASL